MTQTLSSSIVTFCPEGTDCYHAALRRKSRKDIVIHFCNVLYFAHVVQATKLSLQYAALLHCTVHYVSACGIRPKTQFWLFQHIRHSEGALGCKTKVPSWIFDFHQFSGAHWGGWSEPIRDLFVTFLKMCAISIISVWRPNMVSLWSFIVFTSPSVNNFSYLWQNIQILSQTLTKT